MLRLRKKLVGSFSQALREVRPPGWALTEDMEMYLSFPDSEETRVWRPAPDYYLRLVSRLVTGDDDDDDDDDNDDDDNNDIYTALDPTTSAFPRMDWRFNEFPNEGAHCLYVTCVELMTLPFEPDFVGLNVMSVILHR